MLNAVDTNVLVVANGRNDQATPECQLAAIESLLAIKGSESVVLDAGGEILDEYKRHCSYAGQPGVGDEFFRWVFDNQHSLRAVELQPHVGRRFEEFPVDPDLEHFDWDDRVFVSVSRACDDDNQIVNAVDSDYMMARAALERAGIDVRELCPGLLTV